MCEVKLQDIDVHVDIIKKKLTILKEDKAAGDDNLSPRILKAISDEVAYPVAIIFRRSPQFANTDSPMFQQAPMLPIFIV